MDCQPALHRKLPLISGSRSRPQNGARFRRLYTLLGCGGCSPCVHGSVCLLDRDSGGGHSLDHIRWRWSEGEREAITVDSLPIMPFQGRKVSAALSRYPRSVTLHVTPGRLSASPPLAPRNKIYVRLKFPTLAGDIFTFLRFMRSEIFIATFPIFVYLKKIPSSSPFPAVPIKIGINLVNFVM